MTDWSHHSDNPMATYFPKGEACFSYLWSNPTVSEVWLQSKITWGLLKILVSGPHPRLRRARLKQQHLLLFSPRPQGLQHARLPCPPPTPGACSNSCPLSQWYHPTISSSVIPFSSCLQSFPASGSFPMSQFFTSGGQSIGASASASDLPMNNKGWFPLELTGLISLQSKGLSRVFSSTTVQKPQFFSAQSSLWSNSHTCTWLLGKP